MKKITKKIEFKKKKKVTNIKNNIERAISAEEKTISARLSKKTALASSELAKQHIITLLEAHPELHEKYINQSIEELG